MRDAATSTSTSSTVPLAVVRWPIPAQSSVTVTPAASRSTHATCSGPWPGSVSVSRCASTGIQWAKSAPVA